MVLNDSTTTTTTNDQIYLKFVGFNSFDLRKEVTIVSGIKKRNNNNNKNILKLRKVNYQTLSRDFIYQKLITSAKGFQL